VVIKEDVTSVGKGVQAVNMLFVMTLNIELYSHDSEIRRMCGWEASCFAHAAVPLLFITLLDMWAHSCSKRYVEEKHSQILAAQVLPRLLIMEI
jgi:hypothetical protein